MARNKKLLAAVISSDEKFGDLLRWVLERMNIPAKLYGQSKQMTEDLLALQPTLVFLDLDGGDRSARMLELVGLRKRLPDSVPIFSYEASSLVTSIQSAIQAGASDHFSKPLDKKILAAKLAAYLQFDLSEVPEADLPIWNAPPDGIPAETTVDMQVLSLDEFGLNLKTKHLLIKGSVIYLKGPLVKEIFGSDRRILFTVYSTEFHPEQSCYHVYAEPDELTGDQSASLRKWLSQHQQAA